MMIRSDDSQHHQAIAILNEASSAQAAKLKRHFPFAKREI